MKIANIILSVGIIGILSAACEKDVLDTYVKYGLNEEEIPVSFGRLMNLGYASYGNLQYGFNTIDGNLFAAITDEAQQTSQFSVASFYNKGIWSAYNNPANIYGQCYSNIRAAFVFLENSQDYKNSIIQGKDTISSAGKHAYQLDTTNLGLLRSEARVLIAYNYSELIKRYSDVPLVKKSLSPGDEINLPRTDYNEITEYIVSEIDAVKNSLQIDFSVPNPGGSFSDANLQGRITKGTALAIKARTLLYAASELHNSANDLSKWQRAADAAYELIQMNKYALHNNYQNLFIAGNTATSKETIWTLRLGQTNAFERQNYPITVAGGLSGVCPTQDIVDDYEYTGAPDPANPYANRDPRLNYSVVVNNSTWNGRKMELWPGGADDMNKKDATRTGYYLKKFLNDNLDLFRNESKLRSWIVFRYAEVLLNYAEAMNEAFGPDNNNGYSLTARQAVNLVRKRSGVNMPVVVAASQVEMRDRIRHERRIELAFEDHRYWDLLRWKEAETVLNRPVHGVTVADNQDGTFTYTTRNVSERVFDATKMYFFPIPQDEINKSNGVLVQNQNW